MERQSPPRSINLGATCGCYSDVRGVDRNLVTLGFPEELGRLADPSVAVKALSSAAKCWNPEWGGIFSSELVRYDEFDSRIPVVDWMIYVPEIIESVPPPSSVLQLEGLGSVIIVQPCPPRRDDPEQLKVVDRIKQIIGVSDGNPRSI